MFSRRVRGWLALVALVHFSCLFGLSWARFSYVHQRTFDLALYARIAWGLARGDLWSPVLNTHAFGSHLAPVLWPLGLLGRLFGTVPVLLFAQALCIALTVFPIARVGARRLGNRGVWLGVAAYLLYPNLFHAGTYEFHPGTLAVLPMAWSFDALDRANLKALVGAVAGVLCCREDLGAFCLLLALVYYGRHRDRNALYLAAGATAYAALAIAVTVTYAPAQGSLDAHFAQWGGSPLGVVRVLFEDPGQVLAHFRTPERLTYLVRVLAPLSFFSLRAPQLLLPGLPYLALNLLSAFPTAQQQYSHYLTPAVPALIVSGVVGVSAVQKRALRGLWFVTLAIGHFALGGSPLSRDFDRPAFQPDAATRAARQVLAQIPAKASVQAPYALLPHLAERHDLRRAPPPEAGTEYVVLDLAHRSTFARREVLLRTTEEPLVRPWFARRDHALLVYAPPYALFARGRDPWRTGVARHCVEARASGRERNDVEARETAREPDVQADAIALTRCLAAEGAALSGGTLTLLLRARSACPADLALRFGPDPLPARVELLCDGALSPTLLQPGDRVRSRHAVNAREASALRARGLWIGALRASGAAPEAGDPAATPLLLEVGRATSGTSESVLAPSPTHH